MLTDTKQLNVAIVDGSARPFYESVMIHKFVLDFLKLRDLSRPLTDANRLKVVPYVFCD